jgi:hypothetical protein
MITFKISRLELRGLLLDWELDEIILEQSPAWWKAVESIPSNPPMYIRYIGVTSLPRAWGRFQRHRSGPKSFTMEHFLDALESHCPEVLETAQVHEFAETTMDFGMDPGRKPKSILDGITPNVH